ncbi:hypothetical protein HBO40_28830 [Pseudomonas protegens]|uniref:hypothetical protein n=1 Tax=Pseudomonas protegens TaxID=380021 RepID=UPI001474AEDF|nr:hypothetical protein [Pseudomonas protegens]NMZ31652.1 hypothetical protein [Pseudomonas protegens]NMZ89374.1 hypothetical protein [Pseudomonas protegens]
MDKVSQISGGQAEMADWGRDAWSVALAGKVARIYSLYEETYFSDMTLEEFAGALQSWKKFILSQ